MHEQLWHSALHVSEHDYDRYENFMFDLSIGFDK